MRKISETCVLVILNVLTPVLHAPATEPSA
jgi:hypothetical protein